VEVTVAEGSVMLFTVDIKSGDTASVILAPGETGVLEAGSTRPVLSGTAAPDNIFWANRSLDFRGTALREVLTILNKYYAVSITVSNPEILECRLTASFVDEPISRILLVISESFGLSLETRGETYLLTGNGCGSGQN
jgi:ferric-dicitrate binding protein FerR (iron transport regulator)